jgi:hypothetical protein
LRWLSVASSVIRAASSNQPGYLMSRGVAASEAKQLLACTAQNLRKQGRQRTAAKYSGKAVHAEPATGLLGPPISRRSL